MEKFAQNLKELRLEKGLSQMQLSKATGLSHSSIVYWENNKQVPNACAIITLAKFFKVTTDSLLGMDN